MDALTPGRAAGFGNQVSGPPLVLEPGPVWHVSVSGQRLQLPDSELLRIAYETLGNHGDASLGEWVERGRAMHLRRRLSDHEAEAVGPVIDVRGTDEARRRVAAVRKWIVRAGAEAIAEREAAAS